MVVMAISDVLTLNFFWMVRDEGSWLDIGTSISHFCICGVLGVFVAALEGLSEVFVSGVDVGGEAGVIADRGTDEKMAKDENGSVKDPQEVEQEARTEKNS